MKGKLKRNLVRVHWGRELNNFGDCLLPLIVKHFGKTPVYAQEKDTDIVLAGTVLQTVPENYRGIIFGTGGVNLQWKFPLASVLAVRGRLTLNNLQNEHKERILLGDPGLLMSYVFPDKSAVRYKLGVVPHFVDLQHPYILDWRKRFGKDVLFINPLNDATKVISQIKSCMAIVSSSLHGLVIADSFDIPNVRFVIRETMPTYDFDFKYDDYYSAASIAPETIEVSGYETKRFLFSAVTPKKQALGLVKQQLYSLLRDNVFHLPT